MDFKTRSPKLKLKLSCSLLSFLHSLTHSLTHSICLVTSSSQSLSQSARIVPSSASRSLDFRPQSVLIKSIQAGIVGKAPRALAWIVLRVNPPVEVSHLSRPRHTQDSEKHPYKRKTTFFLTLWVSVDG